MSTRILVAICAMLCFATGVVDAQFTYSASGGSGIAGSSVGNMVMLDNSQDVLGFSMGITHDAILLTPTLAEVGAGVTGALGGNSPGYFFSDLNPVNGPGVVVGCVLSLAPPLQVLAPGSGHHLVTITYDVALTAEPGSSSPITFVNTLGNPPITNVVSVSGVSQFPALIHGQITVDNPPASAVTCQVDDDCTGASTLSWANGGTYDSIEIYRNAVLETTLLGSATSYNTSLAANVATEMCVVGIRNAVSSVAACCSATWTPIPPAVGPSDIVCTIDHATCTVTVTWTNNQADYASLELLLDGVLSQSLAGSATGASIVIAEGAPHTISLAGSGFCGEAMAEISCLIECLPERFIRSDGNGDNGIDISDPIYLLAYLFSSGAGPCLDALDANDSGAIDVADAIFVLAFIFSGGLEPPAPFPACGPDPTDTDSLDCANYTC
ncbi:MAG TPA: hypothetical protein EYN79_06380 [Planctomycetes bacterium]|nr:hypothetical protein [Planctomycetota bacterium]HIN79717.1 hypothetical protein [Planctomycetota bacterium]